MWLARQAAGKATIRARVAEQFAYDLSESVDRIRARYDFDVSAAGTVPPAIVCALDAEDYEDAVRNAISLGGDADTLACITGGIAELLYGLPEAIAEQAIGFLEPDLVDVL